MAIDESWAATAYWNQRRRLSESMGRIRALFDAVDRPVDLSAYQWAQLMSVALEFEPDLILELGRGVGNSTCAFTEAAYMISRGKCEVLSVCFSTDWESTRKRILSVVSSEWFDPLRIETADILEYDFASALRGFERVLVFWDAHGYDVAECVLGSILPQIHKKPHIILMHDLSDSRYIADDSYFQYGENGLWRANTWEGPSLAIGNIRSKVEQSVSILDFTTRNRIPLYSADHGLHLFFDKDEQKAREMKDLLGEAFFSLQAHWFWFTLSEKLGPFTFPRFTYKAKKPMKLGLIRRLIIAARIILGRFHMEKLVK